MVKPGKCWFFDRWAIEEWWHPPPRPLCMTLQYTKYMAGQCALPAKAERCKNTNLMYGLLKQFRNLLHWNCESKISEELKDNICDIFYRQAIFRQENHFSSLETTNCSLVLFTTCYCANCTILLIRHLPSFIFTRRHDLRKMELVNSSLVQNHFLLFSVRGAS